MTPRQLLDAADRLLDKPPASMGTCWQRSCACLTRNALEDALDGYWQATAPSLASRPMKRQLIVLRSLATEPTVAREVAAAWNALSRAMHHHAYELPPTVAELRDWYDSVNDLITRLDQAAPTG